MTNYIKEHHTNIFTGQTGCGKIHLVLDLNKNTKNISTISLSFVQHFEIIKRTMPGSGSKTMIRFGLYSLRTISISGLESCCNCQHASKLFIIDDIIANKDLDKRRQLLLELAISGRHWDHYLWFQKQSSLAMPKNLQKQTKAIFVWYPKKGRSQDYT